MNVCFLWTNDKNILKNGIYELSSERMIYLTVFLTNLRIFEPNGFFSFTPLLYWPGYWSFQYCWPQCTFILFFDLILLHFGPNSLTISSSHHCGILPSGCFWSLRQHSTTVWIHLLSLNLTMYPSQWNFCFWYSVIISFTLLCSWTTLLQMCSCHDIPSMDLFIAFCVVTSRKIFLGLIFVA